jgi:hypothetical protein
MGTVAISCLQTAVAVADTYFTASDTAEQLYSELCDKYGGFAGIWLELARFAQELDQELSEAWDLEEQDFIDDILNLVPIFQKLSLKEKRFVSAKEVLSRANT